MNTPTASTHLRRHGLSACKHKDLIGTPDHAAARPVPARAGYHTEPQSTTPRHFTLDGTDHATHNEHARMIRKYIAWAKPQHRTTHAYATSSTWQT